MDDALLGPSLRSFGVMVEQNPFENEACIYCKGTELLTTRSYNLFGKTKKEIVCLQCLAEEADQKDESATDVAMKTKELHSIHTGTHTGRKFTEAISALNA